MTGATLVDADPRTLVVGANTRVDARLDKDFVASIRERGVLQPIVAYRGAGEQLIVVYGQRRTLAAIEADRPLVPVMVLAEPDDVDRIVDQLAENDHRVGLHTSDRVAAYQQLAAIGVPAGEIARRTAQPEASVTAALAVASSDVARTAAAQHDLTLDQAAAVAEFDADAAAVQTLLSAAQRGGFEHQLQRLRDDREMAAKRAALLEQLTGKGIAVVDRPPYNHARIKDLQYLLVGKRNATEANHRKCPGHAAFLVETYTRDRNWAVQYACTNYPKHGHTLRHPGSGGGIQKAEDMTPEEREAAAAERRDVVRSNKLWDSAEKVRRDFLRTLLARKVAPRGAAAFIATALASGDYAISSALGDGHPLAHELLGLTKPGYGEPKPIVGMVGKAGDGRALMLGLGLVLAAYEGSTSRQTWRSVNPGIARYLRYLEANGYELSDVERRACGEQPAAAGDEVTA